MKSDSGFIVCLALLVVVAGFTACAKREAITVSTAISLRPPLLEISSHFKNTHPAIDLFFNFGSSGSLCHQIQNGAPVDIFLSAASEHMDLLLNENIIDRNSHRYILSNKVVLITHKRNESLNDITDLLKPGVKRIAVGEFKTVPIGRYAEDILHSMGLLEKLHPKLVFAKNALQTVAYVESENVEAGIVYKTDAEQAKNIRIAALVPASAHRPIKYSGAIIRNTTHPELANAFLLFLESDKAKEIFHHYDFLLVED